MINIRDDFLYVDGIIYYKSNTRFKNLIGREAGKLDNLGYCRFYDGCRMVYRDRYVWTMFNGQIPDGMEIDHINHIPGDDRIENLRLVNREGNTTNRSLNKNNTSGMNCIYPMKSGSYRVRVRFRGKTYGRCVDTVSEAIDLRDLIFIDLGFHENHGSKNTYNQ